MKNMATTLLKMSHLCLFNLLMITQYLRVIEMTPLCGRSAGSSSDTKNTDKIYFLDQQQSIHSEEINGTIVFCFADGTIINATSVSAVAAPNFNSGTLKSRIENGKYGNSLIL